MPAPCSGPKELPLRRLSALVAMVAAIMFVIGGTPVIAEAAPCNPCPPDCAMMKEMAAKAAAEQSKATHQQDQPDNPCKPTLACAAPAVAPLIGQQFAWPVQVAQEARQEIVSDQAAPSRPPDRQLRPPKFA